MKESLKVNKIKLTNYQDCIAVVWSGLSGSSQTFKFKYSNDIFGVHPNTIVFPQLENSKDKMHEKHFGEMTKSVVRHVLSRYFGPSLYQNT